MKLASLIVAAAALFAAATSPAQAQQNWKVASAAQPGSPLLGFVEEVVAKIGTNTKGAIKAERLFIGSEQEIAQQILRGRIEVAGISMAGIAPASVREVDTARAKPDRRGGPRYWAVSSRRASTLKQP